MAALVQYLVRAQRLSFFAVILCFLFTPLAHGRALSARLEKEASLFGSLANTGYPQVVVEYPGNPATTAPSKRYTYGLDLISQTSGTATHYYGYDGHGSVRMLLNDATGGNTVETDRYDYDANGNLINQEVRDGSGNYVPGSYLPGAVTLNSYLYTGEQWDADLHLYYLRARYYSPELGRFTTMDSIDGNRDEPNSLHKYLYCAADPVNGIDPSGRMTISSVYYSAGTQLFLMGSRLAAFPRALAIARATATALTVGSLIISDEARMAFLSTGNPGAAAASLTDDVGFMIYRGGTLLQRSASTLARSGVMGSLEGPLGAASRRIKNIASDAVVGFRGSVATGIKHSTQGPFNPTDFDLDAFIVSDKLAKQLTGRFRDGRDIAGIKAEADKIEELLKNSFSGYRTEKPFTFRVWTTKEFERIIKEGPHVIQ